MPSTLLAVISRWQSPFLGHLPKTERLVTAHLTDFELLVSRFDAADVLPTWMDAVFVSACPEWAERLELFYCGRTESLAENRLPAEAKELDGRMHAYFKHLLLVLESARHSAKLQGLTLQTAMDLTLAEVGIAPASCSARARDFSKKETAPAVALEEEVGGGLLDTRSGREWMIFPAGMRLSWAMANEERRNLNQGLATPWRIPELDELWRLAAAWPEANGVPQGWFWTRDPGVHHMSYGGYGEGSSRSRSCVSFEGARARSCLERGSLRLVLVRQRAGWVSSPSQVG